jgi:hypothetical protein
MLYLLSKTWKIHSSQCISSFLLNKLFHKEYKLLTVGDRNQIFLSAPFISSEAGFCHLSTVDTWVQIILCCERLSSIV